MARTTAVNRLASIVRRAETRQTGATAEGRGRNWRASEAAARAAFKGALRDVVAAEDEYGVEAVARQSDRVTELRQRAVACGLLTAGDVLAIEREVTS